MRTLIAVFLLLGALPASAQIHKWTDADGKVHYTDHPPGGAQKATTLDVPKAPPAGAAPVVPDWKQREQEYKRRQVAQAERERAQNELHAESPNPYGFGRRAANFGVKWKPDPNWKPDPAVACANARNSAEVAPSRKYRAWDNGGLRPATESERQRELQRLERNATQACAGMR